LQLEVGQSMEISSEKAYLAITQKIKNYFDIVEHRNSIDIAFGSNFLYIFPQLPDYHVRVFDIEMLLWKFFAWKIVRPKHNAEVI